MNDATSDAARRRFTAIYAAYYHRVLGYALRRADADDAADLVADTFATAWRRLDHVPEGEQALFWLYATARRVGANHRRGRRRRDQLAQAVARELPAGPDPAAAGAVGAAFARLREEERELLLLVAWEGLDAEGIAAVLGCSRNAARIRIHRARRRLASALAEDDMPARAEPRLGQPRLRLEDRP